MSTNLRNPADRRDYPARWTIRRGKELFREIDERSADGSEDLLSVSHITGITPRSQKNVTMFKSESLVGYKICRPGDIAANTMWTWQGAIGVSDYFGVISPSYNVYRQRHDTYNPRYLDLLLREPRLVDVYYSLSTGIRPSRRRLYPDEFLTIRFPVPPRAEQDKIVRFLDAKTAAIDALAGIKRKQIDELHELRKTIINRAVTGGMAAAKNAKAAKREGACPHAPSDTRRLGTYPPSEASAAGGSMRSAALPNGWKLRRLKTIVSCNDEALSDNTPGDQRINYVEISDVNESNGIFATEAYLFKDAPSRARRITRKGDVIIVKSRFQVNTSFLMVG